MHSSVKALVGAAIIVLAGIPALSRAQIAHDEYNYTGAPSGD